MIATVRGFRSMGRPAKVLLVNEMGETAGLLMLAPYLADHLTHRIGLAVWLVGLLLGLRHFSEGLFAIGGTLGDRVGYKPVLVAGCGLEAVGSVLFGLSSAVPWLIGAAVFSGLARALFVPARRAYLAQVESDRKVEAFALAGVCRRVGLLIGPLVGILLVHAGFESLCTAAAGVFVVLTLVQWWALPTCAGVHAGSRRPLWAEWREALGDRVFLAFAVTMCASYSLVYQLSFGLPIEVRQVSGGRAGITALFVLSALLGLAGQIRLTLWCERRWTPGQVMVRGLIVMGVAFVPLMRPPAHGGPLIRLLPILLCAAILTVGTMMVFPFEMATIADLAGDRGIGTYYSVNNLLSGVGSVLGNLLSAAAMGLSRALNVSGLPWLVLLLLALMSATALTFVNRSDRLAAGRLAGAHAGTTS
ncbi:MFS transporter [Actinoallomurus purpureus]|uniref:MFS transporter n=1 Tax=Actinoallomurus purpureus TaxID=478114 RepID=UPI0020924621|nr:MFS transporter [Actinoallomurus purpureus]MCO6010919.1 MFS transporter [Actinoallomurus purpureus]